MAVERVVVDTDSTYPDTGIIRDIPTGNLVVDYSKYFEKITTAVESMAADIHAVKLLAEGSGVKTNDPLGWLGLMSVYKLYVEDPNAIGLDALKAYKEKIDSLIASLE